MSQFLFFYANFSRRPSTRCRSRCQNSNLRPETDRGPLLPLPLRLLDGTGRFPERGAIFKVQPNMISDRKKLSLLSRDRDSMNYFYSAILLSKCFRKRGLVYFSTELRLVVRKMDLEGLLPFDRLTPAWYLNWTWKTVPTRSIALWKVNLKHWGA